MKEGRTILCQCEYDVSRSAGAAGAILEAYNGDGITVFSSLDRKPNKLVYKESLCSIMKAVHS